MIDAEGGESPADEPIVFDDVKKSAIGTETNAGTERDQFLAGLSPAKLTFAFGFMAFQNGDYDEAAEYFFNASIEDSESVAPKYVLATSLFSIAEYEFAADYLRRSLEADATLVSAPFNMREFYGAGQAENLQSHRKLLGERAELHPSDADTLLLAGFVEMSSGNHAAASKHFVSLRDAADSDADRVLADQFLADIRRRDTGESEVGENGMTAFLAQPTLEGVEGLPLE